MSQYKHQQSTTKMSEIVNVSRTNSRSVEIFNCIEKAKTLLDSVRWQINSGEIGASRFDSLFGEELISVNVDTKSEINLNFQNVKERLHSNTRLRVNFQSLECNHICFGLRKLQSYLVFNPPAILSNSTPKSIQLNFNDFDDRSEPKKGLANSFFAGKSYFDDWLEWENDLDNSSSASQRMNIGSKTMKVQLFSLLEPPSSKLHSNVLPLCIGTCEVDLGEFFDKELFDAVFQLSFSAEPTSQQLVLSRMTKLGVKVNSHEVADMCCSLSIRLQFVMETDTFVSSSSIPLDHCPLETAPVLFKSNESNDDSEYLSASQRKGFWGVIVFAVDFTDGIYQNCDLRVKFKVTSEIQCSLSLSVLNGSSTSRYWTDSGRIYSQAEGGEQHIPSVLEVWSSSSAGHSNDVLVGLAFPSADGIIDIISMQNNDHSYSPSVKIGTIGFYSVFGIDLVQVESMLQNALDIHLKSFLSLPGINSSDDISSVQQILEIGVSTVTSDVDATPPPEEEEEETASSTARTLTDLMEEEEEDEEEEEEEFVEDGIQEQPLQVFDADDCPPLSSDDRGSSEEEGAPFDVEDFEVVTDCIVRCSFASDVTVFCELSQSFHRCLEDSSGDRSVMTSCALRPLSRDGEHVFTISSKLNKARFAEMMADVDEGEECTSFLVCRHDESMSDLVVVGVTGLCWGAFCSLSTTPLVVEAHQILQQNEVMVSFVIRSEVSQQDEWHQAVRDVSGVNHKLLPGSLASLGDRHAIDIIKFDALSFDHHERVGLSSYPESLSNISPPVTAATPCEERGTSSLVESPSTQISVGLESNVHLDSLDLSGLVSRGSHEFRFLLDWTGPHQFCSPFERTSNNSTLHTCSNNLCRFEGSIGCSCDRLRVFRELSLSVCVFLRQKDFECDFTAKSAVEDSLPIEDIFVGRVVVDLSWLGSGKSVCGWYSIVDSCQRVVGQVKANVDDMSSGLEVGRIVDSGGRHADDLETNSSTCMVDTHREQLDQLVHAHREQLESVVSADRELLEKLTAAHSEQVTSLAADLEEEEDAVISADISQTGASCDGPELIEDDVVSREFSVAANSEAVAARIDPSADVIEISHGPGLIDDAYINTELVCEESSSISTTSVELLSDLEALIIDDISSVDSNNVDCDCSPQEDEDDDEEVVVEDEDEGFERLDVGADVSNQSEDVSSSDESDDLAEVSENDLDDSSSCFDEVTPPLPSSSCVGPNTSTTNDVIGDSVCLLSSEILMVTETMPDQQVSAIDGVRTPHSLLRLSVEQLVTNVGFDDFTTYRKATGKTRSELTREFGRVFDLFRSETDLIV